MLSFNGELWERLTGGCKGSLRPLTIFAQLESQQDTAAAWEELWEELHHQSNVGVASYAAVPELVRIHRMGDRLEISMR
jgi:hypothetical protein